MSKPAVYSHEWYMHKALQEAQIAADAGEVPVGAIVVANNKVIARAHNQTQTLTDVTAHAEMLAITSAANHLGGKYLTNCTLYVTLEPCVMCAGALFWSQVSRIVIGAADPKRGFSTLGKPVLHPKTEVIWDISSDECTDMLLSFFKGLR
ncbi:MAG: nucleoside deaminase [Flexibacteraceae bacterium]